MKTSLLFGYFFNNFSKRFILQFLNLENLEKFDDSLKFLFNSNLTTPQQHFIEIDLRFLTTSHRIMD